MNNIEIYKDDNVTVEIDGLFDYLARTRIVKCIQLTSVQFQMLTTIIVTKLKLLWNCTDYKFISCSKAPIIMTNKYMELTPEFQILDHAFRYLSIIEDRSNKGIIEQELQNIYDDQEINFYIHFYSNSVYNIDGVMAAQDNNTKNIAISFFSFPI